MSDAGRQFPLVLTKSKLRLIARRQTAKPDDRWPRPNTGITLCKLVDLANKNVD